MTNNTASKSRTEYITNNGHGHREKQNTTSHGFLQTRSGMCGYYQKFIQNFNKIAAPLTELTKNSSPEHVPWSAEAEEAFQTLNPFTARFGSNRTNILPIFGGYRTDFCSFHLEISHCDAPRAHSSSSRTTVTNL